MLECARQSLQIQRETVYRLRSVRVSVRLSGFLCALLFCTPTQAQSTGTDSLVQECYSRRQRGDALGSLPLCERAVSAQRTGRTLAQLALTELALERYPLAATHLRDALGEHTDPWITEHRATLEETLGQVRRRVATVVISTNRTGLRARVAGRTLSLDHPTNTVFLAPGHAALTAYSPHGETLTRTLVLTAGVTTQESLHFAPDAPVQRETPHETPRRALGPTPQTGRTQRILGWTSSGLAVVSFGVSLLAWRLREGAVSDYSAQCPTGATADLSVVTRCTTLHASAESDVSQWQTLTTVGIITGGLFAVAAAVLFATAPRERATRHGALQCGGGPGDLGLRCRLSF